MASFDIILEIGHTLSHTIEYVTGNLKVHTHHFDDKDHQHHDHIVLQKIDKAVNAFKGHGSKDNLYPVRLLNFDLLKLISPDNSQLAKKPDFSGTTYHYLIIDDQIVNNFPSPPPKLV